jgi:hypothetical protein
VINKDDQTDTFVHATAIAGDLKQHGGGSMDANWQWLKPSGSENKGLQLTINGGFHTNPETKEKKPQKAVVDFLCDMALEGDENLLDPEDKYEDGKSKRAEVGNSSLSSLTFLKYVTTAEKEDVLYLEWRTKYACEKTNKEQDPKRGEHWGFFTWFIIMYVLTDTWQTDTKLIS